MKLSSCEERIMNDLITILLVEDDEVDVMNLKRAFKKNDVSNTIHYAQNGIEALEMLKTMPKPRLILLDLNMPKMGGLEFLKELRNHPDYRDISVIVMTTSNEEKDKVAAYSYNVAGYILKPLSMEKFVAAIGTLKNYWTLCEYPEQ